MMGEPYPLNKSRPTGTGLPTPYQQDIPPKLYESGGMGPGGGDKFPLPGGTPGGMPGSMPGGGLPGSGLPGTPDQPQPYGGMVDLDGMLQQRKANDERRQMLAQMLAGQQQPKGPAPYANGRAPVDIPAPIAEASPWSIVAAAVNGLADGYRKSQGGGQPPINEGANAFWRSNGGMKG